MMNPVISENIIGTKHRVSYFTAIQADVYYVQYGETVQPTYLVERPIAGNFWFLLPLYEIKLLK